MDDEQLAGLGVKGAERFRAMVLDVSRLELAYSRDSVEVLSRFVSAKREGWLSVMSPDELHRFTGIMGNYFGECIRQLLGGKWCFFGEEPAIMMEVTAPKPSFWRKLTGSTNSARVDTVHWAFPLKNTQNAVEVGDAKSLEMIFIALEADWARTLR